VVVTGLVTGLLLWACGAPPCGDLCRGERAAAAAAAGALSVARAELAAIVDPVVRDKAVLEIVALPGLELHGEDQKAICGAAGSEIARDQCLRRFGRQHLRGAL
jgi:hypothetical protein